MKREDFWYNPKAESVGAASLEAGELTDWWADHKDNNDTLGIGSKLGFLGGDLIIDAEYIYARSRSAIRFEALDPFDSSTVATEDMPDIKSLLIRAVFIFTE